MSYNTENKYITAPLNHDGLDFEVRPFGVGWRVTAVFSSGNTVSFWAALATEANQWIADMTTAYTEGLHSNPLK